MGACLECDASNTVCLLELFAIDVDKCARMTFELEQLRQATEKYTYHDAGAHGVWPSLVWERRNESPVARLEDAVEFLGKWKALRFKGGKLPSGGSAALG